MSRSREGAAVASTALLCLLVLALAAPAAAQAEVLTAEEYLGRLEGARALAVEAAEAPSPARMDEVRSRLGLPVAVRLGGRQADVADDPLLDALEGSEAAHFTAAAARLSALA
ncbi:MAG: hypothetical protein ACRDKW_10905, partial [Actinomycetota bacterium]